MPIIIVLLATLVAFFLAGPFIAVAVLFIGLAILFPNIIGIVAAIIGFAMLSVKLDVSPGMLILIIIGIIIGLVGLIFLAAYITENGQTEKGIEYQSPEKLKEEESEYLKLMGNNQKVFEKQSSVKNKTEKNTSETKEKQVEIKEKSSSSIDDLMKLSTLFKDGFITEDEYQSEKSKLLSSKGTNF